MNLYTFLVSITASFRKPVIYKDLIVSRAQVNEALRLGVSAVLLITKILSDHIDEFINYVEKVGLKPLVEIDNINDANKVLDLNHSVTICINSRDLSNLSISIDRARDY